MEIIFLKRTLAIEEEVASLHGNASVPVKTFKPARLIYLYPQDRHYCMKSICQTSDSLLGKSMCPQQRR